MMTSNEMTIRSRFFELSNGSNDACIGAFFMSRQVHEIKVGKAGKRQAAAKTESQKYWLSCFRPTSSQLGASEGVLYQRKSTHENCT